MFGGTTQSYVAWSDQAVFVTFRGTEPGEPGDTLDDLTFALAPWDKDAGSSCILASRSRSTGCGMPCRPGSPRWLPTRSVWFAGHSLGAALAALAADRYPGTAGVCTLGSPRVGDWHFAESYSKRFGARALRYVNDADVVTHLPPPMPYKHAGAARFIDPRGHVSEMPPTLHHYFAALFGDPGHVKELMVALDRGQLHRAPDFLLDHMPRGVRGGHLE